MDGLFLSIKFGSNFPPNIPHKMKNNLGKRYRSELFTHCKSFDRRKACLTDEEQIKNRNNGSHGFEKQ